MNEMCIRPICIGFQFYLYVRTVLVQMLWAKTGRNMLWHVLCWKLAFAITRCALCIGNEGTKFRLLNGSSHDEIVDLLYYIFFGEGSLHV